MTIWASLKAVPKPFGKTEAAFVCDSWKKKNCFSVSHRFYPPKLCMRHVSPYVFHSEKWEKRKKGKLLEPSQLGRVRETWTGSFLLGRLPKLGLGQTFWLPCKGSGFSCRGNWFIPLRSSDLSSWEGWGEFTDSKKICDTAVNFHLVRGRLVMATSSRADPIAGFVLTYFVRTESFAFPKR